MSTAKLQPGLALAIFKDSITIYYVINLIQSHSISFKCRNQFPAPLRSLKSLFFTSVGQKIKIKTFFKSFIFSPRIIVYTFDDVKGSNVWRENSNVTIPTMTTVQNIDTGPLWGNFFIQIPIKVCSIRAKLELKPYSIFVADEISMALIMWSSEK